MFRFLLPLLLVALPLTVTAAEPDLTARAALALCSATHGRQAGCLCAAGGPCTCGPVCDCEGGRPLAPAMQPAVQTSAPAPLLYYAPPLYYPPPPPRFFGGGRGGGGGC